MTSKTKQMKWRCGYCEEWKEMSTAQMVWNFTDKSYAHPIGFCSEACIKHAQVEIELRK